MEGLRSWWEVPSVAHFCSLFREAFDLPDFDIEDLEESLLASSCISGQGPGDDNNNHNNVLVEQLTLRLLQGYHQRPDVINVDNQDKYLFDLVRKKWTTEEKSVETLQESKFVSLPLRTKVEILFSLCDYRLDAADVMDVLKNLDSESLRVEPLGRDGTGSTYWYFYGTRLYREMPSTETKTRQHGRRHQTKERGKKETRGGKRRRRDAKKSSVNRHHHHHHHHNHHRTGSSELSGSETDVNPDWSVVCSTEADWIKLSEKFRHSTSRTEQELHTRLVDDFLPEIGRIIQDKERSLRKRLLEAMPRRASHRIELLRLQEGEAAATEGDVKPSSADGDRDHQQRRQREEQELERLKREEEQRALERLTAIEERASRASKRLARNLDIGHAASDYESSPRGSSYSTDASSSDEEDSARPKKLRSASLKYIDVDDEQKIQRRAGKTRFWTKEPCLILDSTQRRFSRDSDSLINHPPQPKILKIRPNEVISKSRSVCRVGSFYRGAIALHRPP